jgi:hypothetical protein
MKNLSIGIGLSGIIFFAVSTPLAKRSNPIHLEFAISDSIPVGIDSAVIYRNRGSEKSFHTIEFSLTNKSEMYLGMISFIQYELDEKNEVLSTTFWSEREGLQPYETRRLSTDDSSIGAANTKLVWSVHTVCTDRGTWSIELKDLGGAIPSYVSGEKFNLPAARFAERKCLAQ